ncbi:DUF4065 domain-containing protein [Halovenus aranensis]|uniref:DUF4065 domain-containing protein n=1 Tax=Halovenus aranensis TaxID=890420 RepID=UPI001FE0C1B7|nr:DUF4065 domain-containing protein [Halovenus aranensis]
MVFLLFLYAESIEGVTKLQKLLFLVEKESEFFQEYKEEVEFEFAPYRMGPFSEHVYEELEFLLSLNAIESEPMSESPPELLKSDLSHKRFTITAKGQKIARELESQLEPEYQEEFQQIAQRYNQLPLRQLLEYVYTEYPDYAAESEILEDLEIDLSV